MSRQIKRKEATRLSELLDENNVLPKDKLRHNNGNVVRKHDDDGLTDDNTKNALPNVKLYSITRNVVLNSKVHKINDNNSIISVTDIIVVPVTNKHSEPMVKDCKKILRRMLRILLQFQNQKNVRMHLFVMMTYIFVPVNLI